MRLFLLFSLLLMCYGLKGQTEPKKLFNLDTSEYVILEVGALVDFEGGVYSELSLVELEEIERTLRLFVYEYNLALKKRNLLQQEYNAEALILDKKRRQYFPVTNAEGEKVVWINFFCSGFSDSWKKDVVRVVDGGSCYFNLKVNVNKKKCYAISVNARG